MKVTIEDDYNEYNEEFESDYIVLSTDKVVYISGKSTGDNVIDSAARILLSSHKALKLIAEDYTFNKFVDDVIDECYYIKEQLEESNQNVNFINRSITIDENALISHLIDELNKNLNKDSEEDKDE